MLSGACGDWRPVGYWFHGRGRLQEDSAMFDGPQVKRTQQAVRADRDEDVCRVERSCDIVHPSRSRGISRIAALDVSKLRTVYIMSIEVVTTRFNIFLVLRGLVKGGAGPVPWTAVRGKPARRVQGSECGKIKRR
jgi:hypothetical protein